MSALLVPPREVRAGISRLATGSELTIQGSLGAALFLVGVGLAGTLAGSASMSSTIAASLSARTLYAAGVGWTGSSPQRSMMVSMLTS